MKNYIGVKLIKAEPMTDVEFESKKKGWPISFVRKPKPGYKVVYPDGYESWSPKEVFEKAYFQLERDNTVTQLDVDGFVAHTESHLIGEKTTVVQATLKNGFTITESSSCVDPANFDMGIGRDICMEHIKDKVWNHLGFLLQCGMFGFKGGV